MSSSAKRLLESSKRWRASAPLSFQHRRLAGADIYFLASWEAPFEGPVSFPHDTRRPELWDAMSGTIRHLRDVTAKDGRTTIELRLKKNESRIVVFAERG